MNLSMRDKSLHKRRVSKEHNSNFRAGYVHINEDQLHKTGIRGRKRYLLYIILALLLMVAFGNLLATILVLGILRIDHTGMHSMEFIPYSQLLRVVGDAYFGEIILPEHSIASHGDNTIDVSSDLGDIQFSVPDQGSVHLSPKRTVVTSEQGLKLVAPSTGHTIFSAETSESLNMPGNVKDLSIQKAQVSKIVSDVDDNLNLDSNTTVLIRGNERVSADGKKALFTAKKSLELTAKGQQGIVFDGSSGVYLEQYKKFPHAGNSYSTEVPAHRICVCMPSGKLFLVPGTNTCAQANEDVNPCS